jgi:3-oxoacyl-ACP reductase-like protein
MGFFSKILAKLGIGTDKAAAAPAPTPTGAPVAPAAAPAAPPPPKPLALVDVVAQLEQRAAPNPQKLNWRTSIVDLLKLLDIDSSLAARKELATELGCPADLMGDSAKMNMWLQKTVLAQIAANGGNVPKELLD